MASDGGRWRGKSLVIVRKLAAAESQKKATTGLGWTKIHIATAAAAAAEEEGGETADFLTSQQIQRETDEVGME